MICFMQRTASKTDKFLHLVSISVDNKGVIFDKYVTNLTSTTLALKSELDELKQELVREKSEKFKLERAYENAKEGWIAQNQEVQNLHQVIARFEQLWSFKLIFLLFCSFHRICCSLGSV